MTHDGGLAASPHTRSTLGVAGSVLLAIAVSRRQAHAVAVFYGLTTGCSSPRPYTTSLASTAQYVTESESPTDVYRLGGAKAWGREVQPWSAFRAVETFIYNARSPVTPVSLNPLRV